MIRLTASVDDVLFLAAETAELLVARVVSTLLIFVVLVDVSRLPVSEVIGVLWE
jgi:hypothetical protein